MGLVLFFFSVTSLFIWMTESERKIFYLLVHSPNRCKSGGQMRSLEARASFAAPLWMQGPSTQVHQQGATLGVEQLCISQSLFGTPALQVAAYLSQWQPQITSLNKHNLCVCFCTSLSRITPTLENHHSETSLLTLTFVSVIITVGPHNE